MPVDATLIRELRERLTAALMAIRDIGDSIPGGIATPIVLMRDYARRKP